MSPEEIEAGKSRRGSWTADKLAEWGVPWPPPKGWKRKLIEAGPGNPMPHQDGTSLGITFHLTVAVDAIMAAEGGLARAARDSRADYGQRQTIANELEKLRKSRGLIMALRGTGGTTDV